MATSPLRSKFLSATNLILLGGSILLVASLLVPWWSLHSSIVNGQQSLFDFTIGPRGMTIGTPIGDPSTLLAGFQVVYWIVTIALLPVSVSLGLAAFHGVYCVLRRRRGARVLIAPLWAVIGLVWWFFYFLLVSSLFSTLGLDIPATRTEDVTWQAYQLAGATWGWDFGLWLGIAGTAVLFVGAAWTFRGAATKPRLSEGVRLAFRVHSVGLILLALLNLGALAFLLVSLRNPGNAWLVLAPVALLFAMAVFARVPRTARGTGRGWMPTIPKISLELPKMPAVGPSPKVGSLDPSAASTSGSDPAAGFLCDRCAQRFPTQGQRDAHRLTHAVGDTAADVRKKVDDLGKRLLRGP